MAKGRGSAFILKTLQWFLRFMEFVCVSIILGIFAYFLYELNKHAIGGSPKYVRAIVGISGAAVIYTMFALMLLCCLAGIAFFSFLGFILDILFMGAFIYVAYKNRHGANSCSNYVRTPLGDGYGLDNNTRSFNNGYTPNLHKACKLETACFSFAIAAIVFFLVSAVIELALWRNHKREKAFGPSPTNNYTSGSTAKRRPWQRRRKEAEIGGAGVVADDTLPPHSTPSEMNTVRQSHATDTTVVGDHLHHNKVGSNVGNNGTFGIGNGNHHGVTGTNGAGGYDRYATPTQGYAAPAVGDRAEMGSDSIPVSDYSRNY